MGLTTLHTARTAGAAAAPAARAEPDLRGFCAAPWTEGVLKQGGQFQVCCRNGRSFGDWIAGGLQGCWHADGLQAFRREILEGRFPDEACRNCFQNGTARSLAADLGSPLSVHAQVLERHLGHPVPEVAGLVAVLGRRRPDDRTVPSLDAVQASLARVRAAGPLPPAIALAADKVETIARIARGFLAGDLTPVEVAPYRQVALSDRCNARCIQCPGLYYGNLEAGETLPDEHVDAAFASPGSMVDFFMNGAEFLLYPGWKKVAHHLASQGVPLSLSTNGILLTPANVAYLVDHRLTKSINVSVDGATKETVEAIRVNVKFDRLCASIAHLIAYASERQPELAITFSFVLMKRNHAEFPALVRLVDRLRAGHRRPSVAVYCQGLEGYDVAGYNELVAREHHANVPREALVAVFRETLAASRETGIPVNAFYSHPLERFVAAGCPFPPLPVHAAAGAGPAAAAAG